ncbi:hypothetical protein [Plasmodium yoelii yoelii]
MIIQT